jgi:hypothetical protein
MRVIRLDQVKKMDLGKDENTLTIAERDEVERQILEAIDSYVKEIAKTGKHTSGLMA